MSYATDTEVSVERTKAEIERMITKFGAQRFMAGSEPGRAFIGFEARGKQIRFMLPLPARTENRFWLTPARRYKRTEQEAYFAWEQACRSAWRALGLCIKAKLEAVEQKITTFESEFLANFVLPNGQTMGEYSIPMIEKMAQDKQMPMLMLGAPQDGPTIIEINKVSS